MRLKTFFNNLIFKIGEGKLYDAATELESYFQTIQKDNSWETEVREILNELVDIANNKKYTSYTRKLKEETIKQKLNRIISVLQGQVNLDKQFNNSKNLDRDIKEKFKGLINIQEGSASIETEGGKGTIKKTGLFFLVLAIIIGVFFFALNKLKNGPIIPPKEEEKIVNCDCNNLQKVNNQLIEKEKKLNNQLAIINDSISLLNKNLNSKQVIDQKKLHFKSRRIFLRKIDSINSIILPEINQIKNNCPFNNCNSKITQLENSVFDI